MKNVINDVREIILREDLNEEEKGKLILEYYTDLSEEEQQKYLFMLQDLFEENEDKIKLIDITDLIPSLKIKVQKENIINILKRFFFPNISKHTEDIVRKVFGKEYINNLENLLLKYQIGDLIAELDDSVKKEKFEEICELILESYKDKNNENINKNKVKTIIHFYFSLDEDGKKEKFEYLSNLIINYKGINSNEYKIDLSSKEAFERAILLKEMSEDGIAGWGEVNEAKKKEILKFLTQILEEENVDILENSVLYDFYDAITHNIINLTEEESKIIEAYNKIICSLENSERLQEYDKIIENNGQIEKDNIKDFIREIKIYRLKNGRIPKKYYDYIIREAVLENIDKMEYEDIIKYCLIDMENDNLESIGIHNCPILFFLPDENVNGYFREDSFMILISKATFEKRNVFMIIKSLNHECRHAEQFKKMNENRYDFNLYKMLKENIIFENYRMFYKENYFDMEVEFDARIYACMKTYEYLLEIGVPVERIAQIEDNFMEKEIAKNFNRNRSIKKFDNKQMSINEIFLEFLSYGASQHNDIFKKDYLSKYPILQVEFEYSESGEIIRKSNERIREELNERLQTVQDEEERKKIIEFYEKVMQEPENSKSNEQQEDDYIVFLERNGYQVSDSIRARLQGKSLQSHEEDGRKQPNSANLKTKMTIGQMAFIKKCYYQHTSEERATVSKEIAKEYRDRQSKKSDQGYTK